MHCIDDKANGVIVNHNADWSGEACIAWYIVSDEPGLAGYVPRITRECWCEGRDLIAGKLTIVKGDEPPVNVLTRAVALAVETFLRSKLARTVDDLFIKRGKL